MWEGREQLPSQDLEDKVQFGEWGNDGDLKEARRGQAWMKLNKAMKGHMGLLEDKVV